MTTTKPSTPKPTPIVLTFNVAHLRRLLANATTAEWKDKHPRPMLSASKLTVNDGHIVLTSTDSYRALSQRWTTETRAADAGREVMIPCRLLANSLRGVPARDTVTLTITPNKRVKIETFSVVKPSPPRRRSKFARKAPVAPTQVSTERASGFQWVIPLEATVTPADFPNLDSVVPKVRLSVPAASIDPDTYSTGDYIAAFTPANLAVLGHIRHPSRSDFQPVRLVTVDKLKASVFAYPHTDEWSAWLILMPVRVS